MPKKLLWMILMCSILLMAAEVFAFGGHGHGGGSGHHGGGSFRGGGGMSHHGGGSHGGHLHGYGGGYTSSLLDYRGSNYGGGYSTYGYSPGFYSGHGSGYSSYGSGYSSGGGGLSFGLSLGGSGYSQPYYQQSVPEYAYRNQYYRTWWGELRYGPILVRIR